MQRSPQRPNRDSSSAAYWKRKIGDRIRLARKKHEEIDGLNILRFKRGTLLERLDMLPQHLWEIENGLLAIDGPEIARIAEALDVHPGWFFDEASWEEWSLTPGKRTPSWMLAKTIGDLERDDRDIVEQLIIRLQARLTP